MIGPPPRRRRGAIKSESRKVQCVNKRLDDPDLVLLGYKVVQIFWQQNTLSPILTLDKALHQEPNSIRQDFTSANVFSLDPKRKFRRRIDSRRAKRSSIRLVVSPSLSSRRPLARDLTDLARGVVHLARPLWERGTGPQ